MYFWGQKYQNPPHVVFRGIARATALHGARTIKPMRHPVADAPQPAPSFSASNESAELLCRHGRHRVKYQFIPTASFHLLFLEPVFPQGDSRLGSDGERASGGLKATAAGRFACKPADSRPTPLSAFRTPTAESVGWLLLLFATEKQGKRFFLVLLAPKVQKKERGIPMRKFLSLSTLTKFYQRNWIKARKPDVLILLAEKSRSPEKVL